MKKGRRNLGVKIAAVCMLLAVVLAGAYSQKEEIVRWASAWWNREEPQLSPMDDDLEYSLKVGYFHKDTFMGNYGRYFMIKHSNTDLEVVSMPQTAEIEQWRTWMEQQPWDVMFVPFMIYQQIAADGYFYALEGPFAQSADELAGMSEKVLDLLRNYGGGQLNGLAPSFDQQALFYNKSLFDQYRVTYPQAGMTWSDVFQIAQRFSDDQLGETPYGFFSSGGQSAFRLVYEVGMTEQLQIADQQGNYTLSGEAWQQVWNRVLEGYRNGSLYPNWELPDNAGRYMSDIIKEHPFIRGDAAMMVASYSLVRDLQQAFGEYGMTPFEWAVTSEPGNPQDPGKSQSFMIDDVLVINARSEQVSAAWELVKMINSPQMAKRMLQEQGYRLPIYPQLVEEMGQVDASVFYEREPDYTRLDNSYERMMQLGMMQVQGDAYLQKIMAGELELADALAAWELELQQQALEMEDQVNE